jgi:oxygen-independent coproporphyrinogen-3 oxidase
LVGKCRKLGFRSINFDLIYGLPFQTTASVANTIQKTIALGADRVAFYRMAVIPELFRWQNVFRPDDLPGTDATCDMMLRAIELFDAAGYQFVGLDHFAKPDEPLVRARESNSMRRTFQGMTTGGGLDVLGFGPSAISIFGDAFAQNEKSLEDWSAAIDTGRLSTCRGLDLSDEDLLRAAVIEDLYCNARIDRQAIERRFNILFDNHFANELGRLDSLAAEELIELTDDHVRVTHPFGRLLLRVVAAVFDAYLPPDVLRHGQSPLLASKVG